MTPKAAAPARTSAKPATAEATKPIPSKAVAKAPAKPVAKTPAKAAAKAPAKAVAKTPAKPAAKATAKRAAAGSTATAPVKAAKAPASKPAAPKRAAPKQATKGDPTAGPVTTPARRAKRQKVPAPLLERLVAAAVESLEGDKAENVVVLDIATRSSFADRMIVATGLADRQISAMATHVVDALEGLGVRRIRTEASPDWVLLDAGDIVLHLFKPEARATYALERMWGPDSPAGGDAGPAPETTDEA